MLVAALVGVASALVSLARLWLGNPQALTQVLWAEDGLFPLCIHKADFWTCLADPFAGYLLVLPRLVAWPISLLPWEFWVLAANLAAALIVGVISGFAVHVVRSAGRGWFVSVAIGLLPALSPMVGLEAINAVGSSYMLLLFLASLVVVVPRDTENSVTSTAASTILLLLTALTIPSAVVLIPLILILVLRKMYPLRLAALWLGALIVGLIAQAIVALNAAAPRPVNFGADTLNAWADAVPISILTYWPGLSLGEYSFFSNFTLEPLPITGWLIVIALLVLGMWWIAKGSERFISMGALLLAGLGFGLIPSAIGYTNNRYFVVPLLLWGAALLMGLDPVIRKTRPWIVGLATIIVLAVWWPAFPASAYRATPAPEWTAEVARIEAKCVTDPSFVDRPLFTPFWPPNWGDGLTEPSHPNLPCTTVFRWIEDKT